MIRRVYILVLVAVFGLGPTALQGTHQAQINLEWARQAAVAAPMTQAAGLPLKRLPVRPSHDAATCVVCTILAAPLAAAQTVAVLLNVHAEVGFVELAPLAHVEMSVARAAQCRGPPAV